LWGWRNIKTLIAWTADVNRLGVQAAVALGGRQRNNSVLCEPRTWRSNGRCGTEEEGDFLRRKRADHAFFHSEVDLCQDRENNPTCLCWHPTQNVIAIGWVSGVVTLVNVATEKSKDEPGPVEAPLQTILFNEGGGRMVG